MEASAAAAVGMVAALLEAEDYDDGHDGITEESVAKLMGWLELEIKLARAAAALPPPPPPPPAMALMAGYVTVSGNEESCGSSLSGPASTVMASVDGRTGAPAPPAVPWPWPEAAAAEYKDDSYGGGDDEDEDEDDEWVSQLLTDGPEWDGPCDGQ
ncbi:hypothetical protein ACP4OV_016062 [Aristida adscensionis]